MNIIQNPFFILKASAANSIAEISDVANELSLTDDSNKYMAAAEILSNHKKRITAELAWLPGAPASQTPILLALLFKPPAQLFAASNIPALAKTNLLVSKFANIKNLDQAEYVSWIVEIANTFAAVESAELMELINADRQAAEIASIANINIIEEELKARRQYFKEVIKAKLNQLSTADLVTTITNIIEAVQDNNAQHEPIIIADLLEMYEFETHGFLEKEAENIQMILEQIEAELAAESREAHLNTLVAKLAAITKNWDFVAQPLQLSTRYKGLSHSASKQLAYSIRDIAIKLHNEHNLSELALTINKMLAEVFAEVDEIAQRVAEDIETLSEIQQQLLQEAERVAAEQRKLVEELAYEVEIGWFFKDKLRFSIDGITWRNAHMELDKITKLRWGGVRKDTGTDYSIVVANDARAIHIDLCDQNVYENVTTRLQKTAGVRIFMEYAAALEQGQEVFFGEHYINAKGIELERSLLFSTESQFYKWREITTSSADGLLHVWSIAEPRFKAQFAYKDDDNIHILAILIKFCQEKALK